MKKATVLGMVLTFLCIVPVVAQVKKGGGDHASKPASLGYELTPVFLGEDSPSLKGRGNPATRFNSTCRCLSR